MSKLTTGRLQGMASKNRIFCILLSGISKHTDNVLNKERTLYSVQQEEDIEKCVNSYNMIQQYT